MKQKPILFSAPMVRALLDGTKTQTRRVCKPQPLRVDGGVPSRALPPSLIGIADPVYGIAYNCPYGKQRDQLWVRERFRMMDCGEIDYFADGREVWERMQDHISLLDAVKWGPSIHMFRHQSRITLEITGVRVERLQDITAADALAEGIIQAADGGYSLPDTRHYSDSPDESYASLWEHLNGEGSWDSNPWVWVIEFKKVKP